MHYTSSMSTTNRRNKTEVQGVHCLKDVQVNIATPAGCYTYSILPTVFDHACGSSICIKLIIFFQYLFQKNHSQSTQFEKHSLVHKSIVLKKNFVLNSQNCFVEKISQNL